MSIRPGGWAKDLSGPTERPGGEAESSMPTPSLTLGTAFFDNWRSSLTQLSQCHDTGLIWLSRRLRQRPSPRVSNPHRLTMVLFVKPRRPVVTTSA
jgi:hypothetical protein